MDINKFFEINRYKWSIFSMEKCKYGTFIKRNNVKTLIEKANREINKIKSEINKAQSEIDELKEENKRLLKIVNDKVLELLTNDERDRLVLKLYGEDYDKITKAIIWIYQSDKTEVEITKKL